MSSGNEGKPHVSVCVSGHVDQGKSTLVGRLVYELGGIPERELDKLKQEATTLGKESFCFAFYMDTQKEERKRGITISCNTKDFFTEKFHYTIIDTPGHRDYIKNMLTGSSCADTMILLCSANDEFTAAIAKGTVGGKDQDIQGQTRQHARFAYLQGIKQLIVCINKMDSVNFSQEKYNEVSNEVKFMLKEVGWPQTTIDQMPIIPASAWLGDNLTKPSEKMPWWKGQNYKNLNGESVHVHTLLDALNQYVCIPKRPFDLPLRIPVSGILQIPGIGYVATGRIEQGSVKVGDQLRFVLNGTSVKAFSIEMHHRQVESAGPGDNVGINVKGLDKANLPKVGDLLVLNSDTSIGKTKRFTAMVQVLDHPGELKVGYTPFCCVRTGKSSVKMVKINWRKGKETGKVQVDNPEYLKENDAAEVEFEPQQPLCVDDFKSCEGLGRCAVLEGTNAVMLGRITKVEYV